jgi:hypothetical protein
MQLYVWAKADTRSSGRFGPRSARVVAHASGAVSERLPMSESTARGQEVDPSADRIVVPAYAVSLGVDGEGATHYLGNRVTNDGLPVYVEAPTGEVDVYDLAETPCWSCDDPVEAWIDHVADKRGDWESVTYGDSLVEMLAEGLEGGA